MSAFVVEDKTINQVVSWLANARGIEHLQRSIKDALGVDISDRKGQLQLGEAMFKLNCQGVEERYGEGEAANFRALDYEYQREPIGSSIAALKSLRCWSYQCMEGDIPESSLLFATMDRLAGEIALHIVNRLPEYDAAEWG